MESVLERSQTELVKTYRPRARRPPQLDPKLLSSTAQNNGTSEADADKSTLAVLGHNVLAAAYTDGLFRSAMNVKQFPSSLSFPSLDIGLEAMQCFS